jgi:hypothetical protein
LLSALPPGYVVLHDVRLSGRPWPIDHLVIGPTGVFTIGGLAGDADDAGLARAESEAGSLHRTLGVTVRPILCVADAGSRRRSRTVDGVLVCDRRHLRRAITRAAGSLEPACITRLAAAAGSVLVPAG